MDKRSVAAPFLQGATAPFARAPEAAPLAPGCARTGVRGTGASPRPYGDGGRAVGKGRSWCSLAWQGIGKVGSLGNGASRAFVDGAASCGSLPQTQPRADSAVRRA